MGDKNTPALIRDLRKLHSAALGRGNERIMDKTEIVKKLKEGSKKGETSIMVQGSKILKEDIEWLRQNEIVVKLKRSGNALMRCFYDCCGLEDLWIGWDIDEEKLSIKSHVDLKEVDELIGEK